jgi:dTDP-4-amino-4,6-dideoxygalactose transaminase
MQPYSPRDDLPVTDELARTHLALPMSAVLDDAQAREVAVAVAAAVPSLA